MASLLSFIRGGRRRLDAIDNPHDPSCPTEIWASEDGYLFTRCGGELVAGPVQPRAVALNARAIAAGAPCTTDTANQMALLILALVAKEREAG